MQIPKGARSEDGRGLDLHNVPLLPAGEAVLLPTLPEFAPTARASLFASARLNQQRIAASGMRWPCAGALRRGLASRSRAVAAFGIGRGGGRGRLPVSVKKHSSREEETWEDKLSEHHVRGWRRVSAAGLHAEASRERSACHRHRWGGGAIRIAGASRPQEKCCKLSQ